MRQHLLLALFLFPLLAAGCVRSTAPSPAASQGSVIVYRDGVFEPRELRVAAGATVTFKNEGTRPVWPASGIHPTHLICPGFNALRSLGAGETYQFTFTEKKICPFHNHLSATENGRIIVE
ncbi:hypothetical protein HY628_02400 [Candidatus Uhrbacteria bacterium]|nr:hypothetical protein [Candidatus Uhrbacteria bacterium]